MDTRGYNALPPKDVKKVQAIFDAAFMEAMATLQAADEALLNDPEGLLLLMQEAWAGLSPPSQVLEVLEVTCTADGLCVRRHVLALVEGPWGPQQATYTWESTGQSASAVAEYV